MTIPIETVCLVTLGLRFCNLFVMSPQWSTTYPRVLGRGSPRYNRIELAF